MTILLILAVLVQAQDKEPQWKNLPVFGIWKLVSTDTEVIGGTFVSRSEEIHDYIVLTPTEILYIAKDPKSKWDQLKVKILAGDVKNEHAYLLLGHPKELFSENAKWRLKIPDAASCDQRIQLRFENLNLPPGRSITEIVNCRRVEADEAEDVKNRLNKYKASE